MKKLAWHFDFHSHRDVRIGENPDAAEIARELSQAQVEEVIVFAKCHTGFSYYPTSVGVPHPRMKVDVFGLLIEACRAGGIKVLAYVSFGIDGEAGRRHPEWQRLAVSSQPAVDAPGFICVCPFTGYTRENFLPQVKELVDNYHPDGFFFDTMSAFAECYCETCRQDFRKATGMEIPVVETDDGWDTYGKFRHRRSQVILKEVGEFIHSLDAEAIIGFNQIGSIQYPDSVPDCINRLTLDISTYGRQSLQSSLAANFGSTAPLSADIMPTRFNQGWGDWSSASELSLRQVAVPIFAYRQRLYMGDRLHPEARLTPGTKQALRRMAKLHAEISAEMPEPTASRSPDILLLHSPSSVYGGDMKTFSRQPRERLATLEGAHKLLVDTGYSFAVVAEAYLKKQLSPGCLLIIPTTPGLSSASTTIIESFVEKGGNVLIVGCLPETASGEAWRLPGIAVDAIPWQDHIYLPLSDKTDEPVLVRGDFHKITVQEARCEYYAIPPYDLKHGMVMGWGINPPANRPSETPILTRRDVGKGTVCYLGCNIFRDYDRGGNWQQKEWFELNLPKLFPDFWQQRILSPGGNVELITYSSTSTTWSILINHGGEELTCRLGEKSWPRTIGTLPAYPLTLVLRDRKKRKPFRVMVGNRPIEWRIQNDEVHVELVLDTLWKTIETTWEQPK